jgi:hypothetical protein
VACRSRWRTPSKRLHPTIFHTRLAVRRLSLARPVELFCDLHGHSRRFNIFTYGCEHIHGARSDAESRLKQRVFPHLLWRNSPGEGSPLPPPCWEGKGSSGHPQRFKFSECRFSVHSSKAGTGRVVAWRELCVENSLTLEASFSGSGDSSVIDQHWKAMRRWKRVTEGKPWRSGTAAATPLEPPDRECHPTADGTRCECHGCEASPHALLSVSQDTRVVVEQPFAFRVQEDALSSGGWSPLMPFACLCRPPLDSTPERPVLYSHEDLLRQGRDVALALAKFLNLDELVAEEAAHRATNDCGTVPDEGELEPVPEDETPAPDEVVESLEEDVVDSLGEEVEGGPIASESSESEADDEREEEEEEEEEEEGESEKSVPEEPSTAPTRRKARRGKRKGRRRKKKAGRPAPEKRDTTLEQSVEKVASEVGSASLLGEMLSFSTMCFDSSSKTGFAIADLLRSPADDSGGDGSDSSPSGDNFDEAAASKLSLVKELIKARKEDEDRSLATEDLKTSSIDVLASTDPRRPPPRDAEVRSQARRQRLIEASRATSKVTMASRMRGSRVEEEDQSKDAAVPSKADPDAGLSKAEPESEPPKWNNEAAKRRKFRKRGKGLARLMAPREGVATKLRAEVASSREGVALSPVKPQSAAIRLAKVKESIAAYAAKRALARQGPQGLQVLAVVGGPDPVSSDEESSATEPVRKPPMPATSVLRDPRASADRQAALSRVPRDAQTSPTPIPIRLPSDATPPPIDRFRAPYSPVATDFGMSGASEPGSPSRVSWTPVKNGSAFAGSRPEARRGRRPPRAVAQSSRAMMQLPPRRGLRGTDSDGRSRSVAFDSDGSEDDEAPGRAQPMRTVSSLHGISQGPRQSPVESREMDGEEAWSVEPSGERGARARTESCPVRTVAAMAGSTIRGVGAVMDDGSAAFWGNQSHGSKRAKSWALRRGGGGLRSNDAARATGEQLLRAIE